jgi:hypothetical protein
MGVIGHALFDAPPGQMDLDHPLQGEIVEVCVGVEPVVPGVDAQVRQVEKEAAPAGLHDFGDELRLAHLPP